MTNSNAPIWVVTGAASGIGAALCEGLIADGVDVEAWDLRPAPFGNPVVFDLTDSNELKTVAAADRKVQSFVHCAGAMFPTDLARDDTGGMMQKAFRLHCQAFVEAVAALLPRFTESASIVAITSLAADLTYSGTLAYGASKAALARAVRQLAADLGPLGIRVNAIAPGAIRTPMTEQMWKNPEFASPREQTIPLRRPGEPADVARAVRFLASNDASYITGQSIAVDGGMELGLIGLLNMDK